MFGVYKASPAPSTFHNTQSALFPCQTVAMTTNLICQPGRASPRAKPPGRMHC